jgi:hypothetical protein
MPLTSSYTKSHAGKSERVQMKIEMGNNGISYRKPKRIGTGNHKRRIKI